MEYADIIIICFRIIFFCFDFSKNGGDMYRPPPFLVIEILYTLHSY